MSKLYVVATPIGNLNDLTPRMREALEKADLIAAEDTRVTMKLLNQFDLKKPMTSCHRHNEESKAPQLVEKMLSEDLNVALTCDAGTPGISDPGHLLVRACWAAGIPVEPVCGPSAVVTALSASGFDAREFAFYGFLPREKKALSIKLDAIRRAGVPVVVLYESPHRIVELVAALAEKWPECLLCVCSDLTKKFERIYRGGAAEVLAQAEKLAEEIAGKTVEVKMKAGEGGRVFGSVSAKEIAQEAKKQHNLDLDKKKIQLSDPIKSFGSFEIPIRLHPQVTGKFMLKVTEA